MTINCEFYGSLRDITSERKISLQNEGKDINTLEKVIKILIKQYPKLESYFTHELQPKKEIIILINEIDVKAFINKNIEIIDEANIVFIPTIHGG